MQYIKKLIVSFILVFSFFTMFSNKVSAKEVNVYMFYGKTCPHCEKALEYLESIKDKYDLNIIRYEVFENEENRKTMDEVSQVVDITVSGVPFCVINNTGIIGYSAGITDETYKYHIKKAAESNFNDNVGIKLGLVDQVSIMDKKNNNFITDFAFTDGINLKDKPLFISSVLLGIKDGFNICALWILLFLISALIVVQNKKKLVGLSLIFIISSILFYFAFLISLLSFEKMLGVVVLIRVIIALIALVMGTININSYLKTLDSNLSSVKDVEKKEKFFDKIKKFIIKKSFYISIVGIILLAFCFVLAKLSCLSGGSSEFINLLKINNLKLFEYIFYSIIYILFFMVINIMILTIYVKFMNSKKVIKYNKYMNLLSGILMFLIGILLVSKPDWIMFDF